MKPKFFDKNVAGVSKNQTILSTLRCGLQSLPVSLKVFFVVLLISVLLSFFSIQRNTFFILGFIASGVTAKAALILLNILAPAVLLVAMLKRASWTLKCAVLYLGFFILNGVVGTISYVWLIPEGLFRFLWPALLVGIILNVILIVFLLLFWKNRDYFKQKS